MKSIAFGEFCKLAKLESNTDNFRLWLLMHTLTPWLYIRVIEKLKPESER